MRAEVHSQLEKVAARTVTCSAYGSYHYRKRPRELVQLDGYPPRMLKLMVEVVGFYGAGLEPSLREEEVNNEACNERINNGRLHGRF